MFTAPTYPLRQTIRVARYFIIGVFGYSLALSALYYFMGWHWLAIPWKPVGLIGTALAFYLGFKNNAAYDRLWEGRKIWGGIVNSSRSFTVMARDFIDADVESAALHKEIVYRHVAWLHVLAHELRRLKPWEHQRANQVAFRKELGTHYSEEALIETLKTYVGDEETKYLLTKGNRSSHLLSQQSKRLMELRESGKLDHFRHLAMQKLITEFYTLQGKSERIKNFPLPRQYASGTFFFIVIFMILVPPAMLDVFSTALDPRTIFAAAPLTALCLWVYWFMDLIGEYSENPFEGLANDVPITTMARGIERDIRQMLDETELPAPIKPVGATGMTQI